MAGADIRELDRVAVRASIDVVSQVVPADLARPTPCQAWTLRDLLAHMTAQHHGFAAAARGDGTDLAGWAVDDGWEADPVRAYAAAADDLILAFASDDVLDRAFELPEFSTSITFPGVKAIGFHFIDYVAHGWDVARSAGLPFALDEAVLAVALELALEVPDNERRLAPGAAFAPAVPPAPDDASTLDQFLVHLGRRPDWQG